MAGASGSDEDMVTGRVNRAEGLTRLWAQVPPGQPNFGGPAIFVVEVARNKDDDADYGDGETFTPANACDGLVAVGWSGNGALGTGAGVVGKGGANQGAGVIGFGSGTKDEDGSGGIGVQGVGGSSNQAYPGPIVPPGAGVVGLGGANVTLQNRARLPHAPGVIAMGGAQGPVPELTETGGVGVWAKGADADAAMQTPLDADGIGTPGPDVVVGPPGPEAGVFARGGVSTNPAISNLAAAGVIGLSGGMVPNPSIGETGGIGVFGAGPTGVRGQGDVGAGVHGVGHGNECRGGQFESAHAAQLRLTPQKSKGPYPATITNHQTEAIANGLRGTMRLPRDGQGGDLLALTNDTGLCTLWFCVKGGNGTPARWAQVLLGDPFDGIA